MSQRKEQNFIQIKEDLKSGRISPGTIRSGLSIFLLVSGAFVGIAYAVVAASNSVIGWENLSVFWQMVFRLEVVMFIIQLLLIVFMKGKSNWSQIILNVSYIVYSYKLALDPFVMLLMFAKNDDVYNIYRSMTLIVIIVGIFIYIYLLRRSFRGYRAGSSEKQNKKSESIGKIVFILTPIFFLLTSITGYIIRNQLLGDMENLFLLVICTFVYIGMLIGTIEFVIGAYCVIRFPSFRVNPPK